MNDSFVAKPENQSSDISILPQQNKHSIESIEVDNLDSIDDPIAGGKIDLDLELKALLSGDLRSNLKPIDIDKTIAELETIDRQEIGDELIPARPNLETSDRQKLVQSQEIAQNVLQHKQIKFRIQQLAAHNKRQLEKVEHLLTAFEEIRQQILTGLAQFGSYEELKSTIDRMTAAQIEFAKLQQRLDSQETTIYHSMQEIERSTIARVSDSEHQLAEYHQNIVVDRSRIVQLERDLSLKIVEIERYRQDIGKIHDLLGNKSENIQSQLTEIDRSFAELVESAQEDKLQFYELTAETIDKTQQMEFQFAKLSNQVSQNCENLAQLQTTIEVVRNLVDGGIATSSNENDPQYQEILLDLKDLRDSKRQMAAKLGKFSLWLWILSFALGTFTLLGLSAAINKSNNSFDVNTTPSQQR